MAGSRSGRLGTAWMPRAFPSAILTLWRMAGVLPFKAQRSHKLLVVYRKLPVMTRKAQCYVSWTSSTGARMHVHVRGGVKATIDPMRLRSIAMPILCIDVRAMPSIRAAGLTTTARSASSRACLAWASRGRSCGSSTTTCVMPLPRSSLHPLFLLGRNGRRTPFV